MKRNKLKKPAPPAPTGKSWFKVHNSTNGEVRIDLMEEIGGWGISARDFRAALNTLGKSQAIHLHINSDGGDILEGNEVYNALLEHEGTVRVSIGALAASMASVIAMAGNPISIAKNGWLMIHNPWTIAMGDADEFKKIAGVLDEMKTSIIDAYRSQTDLPEKDISALMTEETWMPAKDALDRGFVDSIDDPSEEDDDDEDEDMKNALRFNLTKFRNSATFLSRPKEKEQAAKSGNTPAVIPGNRDASSGGEEVTNKPKAVIVVNKPMKKEDEETPSPPATKEPDEAAVRAKADELYKAKLKRDQEIDDIVLAVRKRDKKDFGELAAKFKQDDKSVADFSRALVTSEDYKDFEVIGAGLQLIEPLDALRGSPGWLVVTNDSYRALADKVQSKGRGSLPKNMSLAVESPYGVREFMNSVARQFMNAPALPTSAGLTSIEKLPGIVDLGVRPLMVKDLIAPGATGSTTVRYIREKSFTNYATTVAEGAAKPQALFEYEEKDAPVRKIAAYTKVTDELFADYLAMASYINQRLPYMVERTEEDQILNGDGTGQNLTGIMQTSGIQTQAKASDTNPDAIYKAMTKIRAIAFFEPDGVVVNPNDWQILRLLKDSAGQYLGGGPFTGAYGNSPLVAFDSIWGKPCAITTAIAAGTALVGAFRLGAQYFMRQGLTVDMTNSDQDDFVKNLLTIRCEERLALAVYRPLAFCTVTGIV